MAVLICDAPCVHRSKRALRSWKRKVGGKCYGCSLDAVVVSRVFDPDGDITAVAGIENTAVCSRFSPIAKEVDEDDEEADPS